MQGEITLEALHYYTPQGISGCCTRSSQKRGDDCQLARTKEGFLRVVAFKLRARKRGPNNNNLSHEHRFTFPMPFYRDFVISPTHQAYKVCVIILILEIRRLRVSSLWYQLSLQLPPDLSPPYVPSLPGLAAFSPHSHLGDPSPQAVAYAAFICFCN